MLKNAFAHVHHWVFDLDNTLYPPEARLFDQIEIKMTDFVMQALNVDRKRADALRTSYWKTHGTTLAGLMRNHDVDPGPYLTQVHDIDFSNLKKDHDLAANIMKLPGRKIVYTNGCRPYAENVLHARGLGQCFDAVYGVEHAGFHPKPDRLAFETVFRKDGIDPSKAAMFEDDPRNLAVPFELGMRTVLVTPMAQKAKHIEFHTDHLTAFLDQIL